MSGVAVLQAGILAMAAIYMLQLKPLAINLAHSHNLDSHVLGAVQSNKCPECPVVENQKKKQRRKYFMEDMREYFAMEPIDTTQDDPKLHAILENWNTHNDEGWVREREQAIDRTKTWGPFLERGFKGDKRVYVAWTGKTRGFGLFANVPIAIGSPVGVYAGIITNASANSRYSWHYVSDHQIPIPPHEMTEEQKNSNDPKDKTYGLTLDAWNYGNLLRFVNHHDQPNCDVVLVEHANRWHVVYVTNKGLDKDEELTVSYGQGYWEGKQSELEAAEREPVGDWEEEEEE